LIYTSSGFNNKIHKFQAEWFFCEEDDPEEPDLINYPQCLPEPDSAADAANHALLLNNIHKVEGTFAHSLPES
jgi:hypothetical protein